jgi:serine/threonine-protein kinase HipA
VSRFRAARVLLDGLPVGRLEEVDAGTRFNYDPHYLAQPLAVPVSWTLPLQAEPYEATGLHPFFENLLPEGWLLEISTHKLKIGRDDAFGLLLMTCADCVGAVEILPEPAPLPQQDSP